jgi:hypothetical protein
LFVKSTSPSAINTALESRAAVVCVQMPKLGSCITEATLPADTMSSDHVAGAPGTLYARSLQRLELSHDRRRSSS